ncbi:MAG TPA: amidohydrolase [Chitinophagaceae bacterium]|jgi:predicted amidohydrolase
MSSLTLTLIQTQLHWEDKPANLSMLEQKISAIREKTEIVILPEMFSTGFSMKPEQFAETMDGTTVEWMKKIAALKKIILTGSLIIKDGNNFYNRLIWMLPNGNYGCYDKHHLFAYGDEDQYYTPGNKRLIASVKGWKINLQVCYDLRFPVWSRQQSPVLQAGGEDNTNLEYDLLIYVANWPERRNHAWKTLLQARAIENQCFVIGVNRTGNDANGIYHSGDSMVINAVGEILYHKADDEDVFTITLQKNSLEEIRNKFPFWKDADTFMIINPHNSANE